MTFPKAKAVFEKAATDSRRLVAALLSGTVWVLGKFHNVLRILTPWGILLTLLGVLIALVTIVVELEDRQTERTFRAWQLVLTVPSTGSSRRATLEYLNREFGGSLCGRPVAWFSRQLTGNNHRRCFFPQKSRESLAGVDIAGAILSNADLTSADLYGANLRGTNLTNAILVRASIRADLTGADLTGASLVSANLAYATLTRANLSNADLTFAFLWDAVLTDANLTGALLTGAVLTGTDLSGADLTDSLLTQAQLDAACGHAAPASIPAGLIWSSGQCPAPSE